METIIIVAAVIIARFIYQITPSSDIKAMTRKWRQTFRRKQSNEMFDQYFIEPKVYYLKTFNSLPCIAFIDDLEISKVMDVINTAKYGKLLSKYQRCYYDWDDERIEISRQLVELEAKVLLKIDKDWLEIYYPASKQQMVNEMLLEFKIMKAPAKEKEYEINIISLTDRKLDLKSVDIKPTDLNLGLYYNDDFMKVDAVIKERLLKEHDKGIVLLHGLPGTGKTTYLRHLIGSMKKKVMFVSPAVAENLMNPDFMDLLIDNPNSVLVIEDAENIILDRRYSSHSSVSNLLNISDGLLSDCLNVQIICTFNSDIAMVDSALMRKGRLIAKYEFGKLGVAKAQQLSNHLGFQTLVNKPMTLAEITNQHDMVFETKQVQVLGFRRDAVLEN
ncbi:hypothetical protein BH10BAC3_BH10BAC3_29220 [soil metagenome]